VRVVAATNRDLRALVKSGAFRQDLYYRLNVFPISIPPLRDRREDIPLLARAFAQEFAKAMGKRFEDFTPASLRAMRSHAWPGNVRELRNLVERAVIVAAAPVLELELPFEDSPAVGPVAIARMDDAERDHVLRVLGATQWRIRGTRGAAEILGLKPTTLESRMARLGIRRPTA